MDEAKEQLFRQRTLLIDAPIDDSLANYVIAGLLYLDRQSSTKPIDLSIDSLGGSLTATFAIIDTIEFIGAPVHTNGLRKASGAALMILMSGEKGHRTSQADCILEYTTTTCAVQSKETIEFAEQIKDRQLEHLLAHSNLSENYAREIVAKGHPFSLQEAILCKIIDAESDSEA